ncbi:MAG: FtsH protease activity modulator HflK [Endozoicomonadaceae bacterium]|nr:FtsH protease activity modulator HflK [Endozoicomonadaceae bacterium]MBE8232363.1 FtsH protease activity modulator HflK [Endozoicomonadaceae bacterium]
MSWNTPGNDSDPWGKTSGHRKPDHQGPPNLDEIVKKISDFLRKSKSKGSKGSKGSSGSGQSSGGFGWVFGFFALIFSAYLYMAVFIVDEKERAVILRFGKYTETFGPGLHIHFPPIDKKYKTQVTGFRVYHVNQEMLTKDENIVQVSLSVQYNISDVKDYELKVASPIISLEEATQSALRHVVGSSSMHGVLTEGRELLAEQVKLRLQTYLDNYKTGLLVSRVNVESAQPPKSVQAAFDDVIRAREDEERYKNFAEAYSNQVIPEARGEAQKLIEKALAYKSEVVALAEGEAARFKSILTEYKESPKITRERLYLTMMQDVLGQSSKLLIDDQNAGNVFYLPLDQLMKQKEKLLDEKNNNTNHHFTSPQTQTTINEAMKKKQSVNAKQFNMRDRSARP